MLLHKNESSLETVGILPLVLISGSKAKEYLFFLMSILLNSFIEN